MARGENGSRCMKSEKGVTKPHSHALGRACTVRLARETTGRVLAKTKTKTHRPNTKHNAGMGDRQETQTAPPDVPSPPPSFPRGVET